MTLKFQELHGDSTEFLYLLPSKFLFNGYYRTYWVYLDDECIGTTLGQEVIGKTKDYDDILICDIVFNKYGRYRFDARELMNRMMKSMTMTDLLVMGEKI